MNVLEQVKNGTPNITLTRGVRLVKPVASNGQRIMQCFMNTDMRNNHDGLRKIAAKEDIDVSNLLPGQYVMFINSKRTHLKLYASDGVIAHWKARAGQELNLATIQRIPRAFTASGRIDYDSILKETVEQALERKRRKEAQE